MEKEIICGIYKITSPSGRVYIGESVDIKKRWCSYNRLECYKQRRLYSSLLKYGHDNHIFEIIEECAIEDLFCRERYWQDFYDVLGDSGLNCRLTECGELKIQVSDETKNKISESNRGKFHSDKTKENISKALKGTKQKKETVEKRVSKIRGKESKLKGRCRPNISNKLKGRKSPISCKCCFKNTVTDEIFFAESFEDMAKLIGIPAYTLRKIKNKLKTRITEYEYIE